MRGALSSVSRHKQTLPLSAINFSTVEILTTLDGPAGSRRCQSQILVENRDFCPIWGVRPRRNIATTFGMEKTRMVWILNLMVKKI